MLSMPNDDRRRLTHVVMIYLDECAKNGKRPTKEGLQAALEISGGCTSG